MLEEPTLHFYWMDVIDGLALLLKNPAIRDQMIFDESELTDRQKAAGHFLCGNIAKSARALMPRVEGRTVLPLYIGWWSDSTNVCFGGTLFLK